MQSKTITIFSTFSNLRTKIILLILFFILYSLFFIPNTLAQTSASSSALPNINQPPQPVYIPPQSPNSATQAIYNFSHAALCVLIGQSPIAPCLEYKIFTDSQGLTRSFPVLSEPDTSLGAFGLGKSILASLYSAKPLSSSEFIADMGRNIGLVKEVSAQVGGSGNAVLSPVYKLWVVSRNIAYVAMILVFLTVGFMVMFRQKLNPQTVVSIQLALPGLVIGLVLITFSYFLASLITDMAFLATDLVGYYFQAAQTNPNNPPSLTQLIATDNALSIGSRITSAISDFNISSAVDSIFANLTGTADAYVRASVTFLSYQYGGQIASAALGPFGALIGLLRGFSTPGAGAFGVAGAGAQIGSVVGSVGVGVLSGIVGSMNPGLIINLIASFVLTIMLILTIFRLILKLLNNFLSIIFYTIFSPFVFLMSALPGRQGLVNDWARNILCNVLAFPAVIGVMYFCYYLLTSGRHMEAGAQAFAAANSTPLAITNPATLPLLGGLDINVINVLLAFGAFIATPSIPDIVCKAIGKIGPAAGMIENQITGSQRSAQGYARQAASAPSQLSKDAGSVKGLYDEKGFDLYNRWTTTRRGPLSIFRAGGDPNVLRGARPLNP